MSIEQKINQVLQKTPGIKKGIKRVYQLGMYAVSPKIKAEGNLTRLTPDDGLEYFFGYYDKSPWNADETQLLALRAASTTSDVAPKEPAEIVLIDLASGDIKVLGETRAWNVQQGAMLQWLGPDHLSRIIYNDFIEGAYVSVILDIQSMDRQVLPMPVYSVSEQGDIAMTLDFSRLHRLRPGYGYGRLGDATANEQAPESPAIWKMDLASGSLQEIISYKELTAFQPRDEMSGAEHKVNHIMLAPNGKRLMFLHRWVKGGQRFTRLITMNSDGSEIYNLSDDNMASHSFWKNDTEIISYLRKEETGNGYYLMKDKTEHYEKVLDNLSSEGDGHPSFSPDGSWLITDTYPNRQRLQSVILTQSDHLKEGKKVAKVFAPFKYDNDVRCDLHPRWDRKSKKVCIDATHEGKRAMYALDLDI